MDGSKRGSVGTVRTTFITGGPAAQRRAPLGSSDETPRASLPSADGRAIPLGYSQERASLSEERLGSAERALEDEVLLEQARDAGDAPRLGEAKPGQERPGVDGERVVAPVEHAPVEVGARKEPEQPPLAMGESERALV